MHTRRPATLGTPVSVHYAPRPRPQTPAPHPGRRGCAPTQNPVPGWHHPSRHDPAGFLQRLAALVSRPRLHLIRFHGVLAPKTTLRSQIIPGEPDQATGSADEDGDTPCSSAQAPLSWAQLLKRVFEIDMASCPPLAAPLPSPPPRIEDYRDKERTRDFIMGIKGLINWLEVTPPTTFRNRCAFRRRRSSITKASASF